jgi:hypothetical protein
LNARPYLVSSFDSLYIFSSTILQLSPEEAATIANQANGLPGSVLGEGATPVVIGGTKYMVLRADDNVFYVRQVTVVADICLTEICRRSRAAARLGDS